MVIQKAFSAAAAGEEWLQEAKLAARRINKKDAQEMKGFGRYLLGSIDHIIQEKRKTEHLEKVLAQARGALWGACDLCNELNQDQEAPWKDKQDGIDGLVVSQRWHSSLSVRVINANDLKLFMKTLEAQSTVELESLRDAYEAPFDAQRPRAAWQSFEQLKPNLAIAMRQ